MTVLGCGTMGIAILSGILASLQDMQGGPSRLAPPSSGTSTPAAPEDVPSRLPTRFIACVRRPESAKKVKSALREHLSAVSVVQNDNLASVKQADIVLLACKPYMVQEVLGEAGMSEALNGKLLISILAGVGVPQLETAIYGGDSVPDDDAQKCRVVRAMPNTASLIRESMTVINTSTPPLPQETMGLVTWIFKRIGDVVYLPPTTMDACTALCGSGPAFFALMLEAAIDGAVAMGLPRAEAQRMAAQTMRGAAGLVLNGEHPAILRDKVSTPGGCTIGGLLVLEEGRVRGTVARAVREATVVASQLGKGVQGVNGTRFSNHQMD
ncbi:pyrroline-5-carboxylate reductase dimerization-domain-containing protein [Podospora didyma]|uniref:Pyrroline-5-carboxylate reductase n=1 Tax=Podospora didyma TaxID=330526 RepID=A0AAE0N8P3_9PEZI|nr:pyrroline-5-carboxylate reductase dimerization-domain-containing protein [Podospora didyma]